MNRVLSGLEKDGVIVRIKRKGSFVAGDTLRPSSYRIGIYSGFPDMQQPPDYFSAFGLWTHHARETLRRKGHVPVPFSFEDMHRLDFDRGLRLDGLLYIGAFEPGIIEVLSGKNFPVVQILQTAPVFHPFHQVVPDMANAFLKIARVLSARLSGKIHLLPKTMSQPHLSRIHCIRDALLWGGIPKASIQIHKTEYIIGDDGQVGGYKFAETILPSLRPDDLYFSSSDFFAFGMLSTFLTRGLVPGKDFQLIGFDNLEAEGFLPFGQPILSTVDFPKRKIIEEALRLLEEKILHPGEDAKIIQVPCDFIERKTFFLNQ